MALMSCAIVDVCSGFEGLDVTLSGVVFNQAGLQGELKPESGFYAGPLMQGAKMFGLIRVRSVGDGVESQFKAKAEDLIVQAETNPNLIEFLS